MNAIVAPSSTRPAAPVIAAPRATQPAAGVQDWTKLVFARLSHRHQHSDGVDLLEWAIQTFGPGLSLGTGLGASGIVLVDLALQVNPEVDVFYIDTGYFFPETLTLVERLEHHYQRSFRRVTSDLTIAQQEKRFGPNLYANDPNLCCQVRKVLPLQKALADSTAWATALRHDQSSTRKEVRMVQWNERYNVVKIAPLAYWTEADVWQYIHEHKLPYNTLHDQHYPSIGCWPCTKAVNPGDDLRAGRWQGTEKKECGLHWELTDHAINTPAL
jgi:phosphoadenosine phosphosulfate reductase